MKYYLFSFILSFSGSKASHGVCINSSKRMNILLTLKWIYDNSLLTNKCNLIKLFFLIYFYFFNRTIFNVYQYTIFGEFLYLKHFNRLFRQNSPICSSENIIITLKDHKLKLLHLSSWKTGSPNHRTNFFFTF